jgi:hypothetical protein
LIFLKVALGRRLGKVLASYPGPKEEVPGPFPSSFGPGYEARKVYIETVKEY